MRKQKGHLLSANKAVIDYFTKSFVLVGDNTRMCIEWYTIQPVVNCQTLP